jgi:heme/copper-type cytochrome/quinol oxidase subunit 4
VGEHTGLARWRLPLAIGLIGFANALGDGQYNGVGVVAIGLAIVALATMGLGRPPGALSPRAWGVLVLVLALSNNSPALVNASPGWVPSLILVASFALALGAMGMIGLRGGVRLAAAALAVGADLAIFFTNLFANPLREDLFTIITVSGRLFLRGVDPYRAHFVISHQHLTPGLTYGPGIFLVGLLGRAVGTIRLVDLALAALLVLAIWWLARQSVELEVAWPVAAALLAAPLLWRAAFIGYAEMVPVTGLAVWLVLRDHHPRFGVSVLAVGLTVVPTVLPLLLFAWLWLGRARREITAAGVIALLLMTPFALWAGLPRFVYDTGLVEFAFSPSHEALGLNSLWWHWTHTYLPAWVGLAAIGLALAALLWRRPNLLAAALEFGAVLLLVVVWVAKFAHSGYYLIVVVGLLLAASLYPVATPKDAAQGSHADLGVAPESAAP